MPFQIIPPLYHVWRSMRDRCLNQKTKAWSYYGGRGITICSRWDSFETFIADMGPRPEGYSLDRIDNNAGYSPENCRWADKKTQQRNRRNSVYVTVEGITYRAIELAETVGIKTDTIVERAKRGLPLSDVLSLVKLKGETGFTLGLGGKANGERQKAKTHCPHGHEYSPENTIVTKQGWRRCRTCFNAKEARIRAARRDTR